MTVRLDSARLQGDVGAHSTTLTTHGNTGAPKPKQAHALQQAIIGTGVERTLLVCMQSPLVIRMRLTNKPVSKPSCRTEPSMKGPPRKRAENRQSRKKGTCTAAMHASTKSFLSENLAWHGPSLRTLHSVK